MVTRLLSRVCQTARRLAHTLGRLSWLVSSSVVES